MLFLTNICMARHSSEQARSIAVCTPPWIDMWAPNSTFFVMSSDCARNDKRLEPLWMPIRLFQASLADVFEEFVNRCEQNARAFAADAHIEIEFVVEEIDIAIPEQPEQSARSIEIVGVNDAIFDRERGGARARDAVACAGHDVIENLRERPEYWDGEHVAIGDFDFAVALHETRVAAEPGEIVAPAERTLGGLVAVVEIG